MSKAKTKDFKLDESGNCLHTLAIANACIGFLYFGYTVAVFNVSYHHLGNQFEWTEEEEADKGWWRDDECWFDIKYDEKATFPVQKGN